MRNEGPSKDPNDKVKLHFTDVAMATGADDIRDARGLATADFDNDGDLDIVVNNNPGDSGRPEQARATLLRNNVGQSRNWLAIELRGTKVNHDAVGAMVTVEAGGEKFVRLVTAGSGFASQHSARLYFGLGDKTSVDSVTVKWPNGSVEKFERAGDHSVETRHLLRITETVGIETLSLPAMRPTLARSRLIASN